MCREFIKKNMKLIGRTSEDIREVIEERSVMKEIPFHESAVQCEITRFSARVERNVYLDSDKQLQ